MKKCKILVIVIACMMILSGCSKPEVEYNHKVVSTTMPAKNEDRKEHEKEISVVNESIPISPPNLSTEDGIREYLLGEWIYNNEFNAQVACNMNIDKDLNIHLLFDTGDTGQAKEEFYGRIELDRIYAEDSEVPDIISIELIDTEYPGGDFFFLHRTIYDGKRVMSLFFAGNSNSIFELLGPEGIEYTPELLFEKVTGEQSEQETRKSDEFYAVFWGHGEIYESMWIDDAFYTPSDADYDLAYPRMMNLYENDISESVLYKISLAEDLYFPEDICPGDVYFVETDENANITNIVSASYKTVKI